VHARRALEEAIDLARPNGGTLTVMTVAPQPSVWAFSGYDVPVSVDPRDEQVLDEYRRILDRAVATVPPDLDVTRILIRGSAGPAIADEANAGGHDPS